MKTSFLISLVICSIAVACSPPESNETAFDLFASENIVINEIEVKEIVLAPPEFSGVGRIEIIKKDIIYFDKAYQSIFRFTADGSLIGKGVGQGAGPNEVGNISYISGKEDGQFVIIGDFTFHLFLNDTSKTNTARYDFDSGNEFSKLENEPSGEYPEIYYLDWSSLNDNFLAVGENHFFTPIITEHPLLNALQHTEFYTNTYSIGKFDLNNGKLLKMGGKWPEIYLQNKFVPNLAGLSLSSVEDKLFASYQIEPLVYVFDQELELTAKFGVPGREMNTNYRTTNTIEDAIDNWSKDLENQGFYSSIYADDDYVFRTYHPNGNNGETRLQIYQDMVLIGDVSVPKRFRVMGKIGDTFYADGVVDEENDFLKVYIFQL